MNIDLYRHNKSKAKIAEKAAGMGTLAKPQTQTNESQKGVVAGQREISAGQRAPNIAQEAGRIRG